MNNSRTKNSILNMVASVGTQLVGLILSFASRTIFLKILSVGYLGINGLFNDVLSMLNMAELGLGTAMTFSMYKPLAENDCETLSALTHFYQKVYRIIALSVFSIGVCFIPFLPYLVNLETEIEHIVLYYILALLGQVSSYFCVSKTTVLYADQKNHVLLKYSMYWNIAQVFSMIIVLWLSKSYVLYLITQLLFVYGQNFHKSFVAKNTYPFLSKKEYLPPEKKKKIFQNVGSAFVYKVANVLTTSTDNILISMLVSTEMVGYYSNYQIIIAKISNIVGTLFYSLIASLGNLIVKESAEKRYVVFQTMQTLCMMLSGFFVSCVYILEDDFIRVWLGDTYVLDGLTRFAVILIFYFTLSLAPVTTFREAAGLFRRTKFITLWTAILNLFFSILLGKMIGLAGILFATSIAKVFTNYWYEPRLLFRDYFDKPCHIYFTGLLKNAVITVLITGVSLGVSCWIEPTGWISFVAKGVLVACSSFGVTVAFYFRTPGFKMLLERVKTLVCLIK